MNSTVQFLACRSCDFLFTVYLTSRAHSTQPKRVEMFAHSLISTCWPCQFLAFLILSPWHIENARAKIIILIELTFGKQPRLVFFFLSRKHLKCELFNNQDWIPNWFIDDDWLSFVVFKSQFAFIDHVKCILCRRSKFYMHLRRLNRRCGITFFVRKWWIFGFWKENR